MDDFRPGARAYRLARQFSREPDRREQYKKAGFQVFWNGLTK